MARASDIGRYFDTLIKRGRGGRRLEGGSGSPTVGDRLRDAVGKGRDGAVPSRTAVVTVEYTPAIDGDPDPGEVVWVWVPFEEDPTQGKDRPVVVIGRRGDALVGVPLTTKQHADEAQVEVGSGDWDPKRRVSYARIWRMLDVDPAAMRREGAVLERDRFDRIVAAIDEYYDVRRTGAPTTNARGRNQAPGDDH